MSTIFETQRLRARPMTPGDFDFVAAMLSDPEVMRYYPRPLDRQEATAWIARQLGNYAEHGYGRWLIEDRSSGQPVGQVGLLPQRVDGILHPEVAYMIDRPWWRRGFAAEAASASRDHGFGALGVDRVISLIRPENLPSIGVARKMGMTPGPTIVHADLSHVVFSVDRPGADSKAES